VYHGTDTTTLKQSKYCISNLHFLDVFIERTSTGFITSTYRKATHTGLYSKWPSFVPLNRKRNLVNSTPPCLWYCQFLRTGAHGIYEY